MNENVREGTSLKVQRKEWKNLFERVRFCIFGVFALRDFSTSFIILFSIISSWFNAVYCTGVRHWEGRKKALSGLLVRSYPQMTYKRLWRDYEVRGKGQGNKGQDARHKGEWWRRKKGNAYCSTPRVQGRIAEWKLSAVDVGIGFPPIIQLCYMCIIKGRERLAKLKMGA